MLEILLAVTLFTLIILMLVLVILYARYRLVPRGKVHVEINNAPEKSYDTPAGGKLLTALADAGMFLPSACGGTGVCGQCRVKVLYGGGDILPTELSMINKKDAVQGYRLACQVALKQDVGIELPESVFAVRRWECTVVSNHSVATFIKELGLALPEGEGLDFEPGSYLQLEAPPHHIRFRDFDIPAQFRDEWDGYRLWDMDSEVTEPVMRAYSMANYPGEAGGIKLIIRIVLPPTGSEGIPSGKMSSYLFSLKPGDKILASGPYGEFFPSRTRAEMIYVGGGSGMAPLRSHIMYLLKEQCSTRRISYWYGARSRRELFYQEDFAGLARQCGNFSWHPALSAPLPQDQWTGHVGFIHEVLYEQYLKNHPAPEDCEYYLCGPPQMLTAMKKLLYALGVDEENIFLDDFSA